MGRFTRLRSIISTAISVLVILISLGSVTSLWILQDDLSSSAVTVLVEVDNVAEVIRRGIARIEPELLTLSELISKVETASEEIAENVSDEGLIPRLLPQSVNDGLSRTTQTLRDNFIAVYDLLEAASDILLAFEDIPFVDIPQKSLSTVTTLQESMEELSEQADTLESNISDFRSEAGARISQISTAAALLSEETEQFRTDLIQVEVDLESLQDQVKTYQRITPPLILTTAINLSLFSAWVVYSQVMLISHARNSARMKTDGPSNSTNPSKDE